MEVRLPTGLYVLKNFQIQGVNVILGGVFDQEAIILRSHLKDTLGHGNKCTHAKPVEYDGLVQWDKNRFIKDDMPNHINRDDTFPTTGKLPDGNTRRGHKGNRRVEYYWFSGMNDSNEIRWGVATIGWTCISDDSSPIGYRFNMTYRHDYYVAYNNRIVNGGWIYDQRSYRNYYDQTNVGGVPDVSIEDGSLIRTQTNIRQKPYGQITGHYNQGLPQPTSYFDFGELPFVWGEVPRSHFHERIMTAAFTNAFEQVPQYADNNIANMLEIAGVCKDMLTANPEALDKWGNLAKRYARDVKRGLSQASCRSKYLRDAWMTYRYAYSTTKSDVVQAIDTAGRRAVTYLKPLRFDGQVSLPNPFQEGEVRCHVQFDIVINAKDMLRDLHHYLQLYGVMPSLYKAWDLVPFSFVADWFFDIGGMLEKQERESTINDYIFSNFWWSIKYLSKDDLATYRCYSRWSEEFIPEKLARDYNQQSSAKTWLKRTLDGYCLAAK